MIRKTIVHRRNRRNLANGEKQPPAVAVPTVTSSGTTNVTLDFNLPVSLDGLPGITLESPLTIVSASQTDPTRIVCVASANVATKDWSIAANDPAIRTAQGGYAAAASGTFP